MFKKSAIMAVFLGFTMSSISFGMMGGPQPGGNPPPGNDPLLQTLRTPRGAIKEDGKIIIAGQKLAIFQLNGSYKADLDGDGKKDQLKVSWNEDWSRDMEDGTKKYSGFPSIELDMSTTPKNDEGDWVKIIEFIVDDHKFAYELTLTERFLYISVKKI